MYIKDIDTIMDDVVKRSSIAKMSGISEITLQGRCVLIMMDGSGQRCYNDDEDYGGRWC